MLNLDKGYEAALDLMSKIRTALSSINRKINWPLVFSRPTGTQIEIAETTDLESPLAIDRYHVGFRLPMHDSAAGCVMLAASSQAQRERVYGMLEHDPACTNASIMSDLQARIRRAEQQGYAWHRRSGKREAAMAVPV